MGRSLAAQRDVKCTACGYAFQMEVWVVVDCAERPDLVERLRDGRLHALICPACSTDLGELDAYFALVGLGGALPVLLSLPRTISAEQTAAAIQQLVLLIDQEFGRELLPHWMERLCVTDRGLLRVTLTQWLPHPPAPWSNLRLSALLAVASLQTGRQRRNLINDLPELLEEDCFALADRLIAAAKAGGHTWPHTQLLEARDLLCRCAKQGIDQVLPEGLDAVVRELERLGAGEPGRTIELCRLALSYSRPEEGLEQSLSWERFYDMLATSLLERRRPEDMEETILLLEGRERASPQTLVQKNVLPEHWATREVLLGVAYQNRSLVGEREHNIERSIERFGRALEVFTRDEYPELWAEVQVELIEAYAFRIAGDPAENLAATLSCAEKALEIFDRKSHRWEWFRIQLWLGRAYLARRRDADHAGRIDPAMHAGRIDRAIEHLRAALEVCDRGVDSNAWASCHVELAIAYRNRVHAEDREETIETAIEHLRKAHEVFIFTRSPEAWASTHHRLGDAFCARMRGDRRCNDCLAICHYRRALKVRTLENDEGAFAETQEELGDLHFRRSEWPQALAAYRSALQAREQRFADTYTERARTRRAGGLSQLYARAAYCLLRGGAPGDAFAFLEAGRARILSQELLSDDLDLSMLPQADQADLARALENVRSLESELRHPSQRRGQLTDAELADRLKEARRRWLVQMRIAAVAHPEIYPVLRTEADRLAIAPAGGAVVAYLVTSMGSCAFVFTHGTRALDARNVVALDQVTSSTILEQLSDEALSDAHWLGAYVGAQETGDTEPFAAAVEQLTLELWPAIVGPVFDKLRELGTPLKAPVVILTHGLLGILPLGAVGRDGDGGFRTLGDDYTVAYAPSISTLAAAQRRAALRSRNARSFLAVADPTGDLAFAGHEVDTLTASFEPDSSVVLRGLDATQQAIMTQASARSYLHFACHGSYDWGDVMRSGLLLAEGDVMTLAELMSDLALDAARLVTLSACETGLADILTAPDEYVGLAAGFLRAGAPAVVATLWPVDDFATALLMEEFYRRHVRQGEPIARALAGAQSWLQKLTRDDLVVRAEAARDIARATGARERWACLEILLESFDTSFEPDDHPFASPYYWASFVAAGATC